MTEQVLHAKLPAGEFHGFGDGRLTGPPAFNLSFQDAKGPRSFGVGEPAG